MHLPNKIRVDLKKNGATLVEHAKCVECVPNVEAAYNVEAAQITTTSGGTLIRKFFDRYMTSICNTSTLPTFSNHPSDSGVMNFKCICSRKLEDAACGIEIASQIKKMLPFIILYLCFSDHP